MSDRSPSASATSTTSADDRLDSWKEIAAYLKRDVTTVQRWEKREGMPVRRHLHDKIGSVYALKTELDAWTRSRSAEAGVPVPLPAETPASSTASASPRRRKAGIWVAVAAVAAAAATLWQLEKRDAFWRNPIADARSVQVTDLDGTDQAVAVSRDGKFVAFLANRDGRVDVWVTEVGTGQFRNLTRGARWELVNPSIRTPGFSPDGAVVTFWTRQSDRSPTDIGMWAVPVLDGPPRLFLEGVAEADWSSDGSRLVYHTPGPGDPMFVKDPVQVPETRQIFAAPPGLHSHFLLWSMDQAFIYFVQGTVPDRMDIWRIKPTGGEPERITHHESRVSHPIFTDPRTLLYLATDSSGSGPWLYSIDVEKRIPHRVSAGIDAYTSLAATADGGRLVAALATTRTTLWRVPNSGSAFDAPAAVRIPLSTASGFSPRLGPGYLVYVSSHGTSDSIWKQQGDVTTELWAVPDARIIGGPAIDPEGRRIAFSARQRGEALLYVMNSDGTDARIVGRSLEWQGDPTWTSDGGSITSAALDDGVPHLFTVPLDGAAPSLLGHDQALDPAWSPDGRFVVFSGVDIGTTFPVSAMNPEGRPYSLPSLTLSRGARHLRFMPGAQALVVLRGEIRHKDLWSVDLDTGAERQLTHLAPDFEVRDFDVSPDGRELVLERAQAHSEIVLLDLSRH